MTAKRKKSKPAKKPAHKQKRRAKPPAAVADATLEAQRIADLLTTPAASSDFPIPPPAFMTGPLLAGAARVWKDAVAHLDGLGLYGACDKYLLAAFCVYTAEYVQANAEVLTKGYSVEVKTISGDKMPRTNPAVARRDDAFKYMLELSKCFGFTPRHMHELVKLQRSGDLPLFAHQPQPAAADDGTQPPDPGQAEWNELMDQSRPN